jgi:DNA-binding response OmpR family regulator
MEKAMRLDQDSRVQYRLQECPLEDNSDVLESGQVGGSKVRILRLVTTPLEGYKLLRKLRSDPLMSDVPIIILTR